MALVAAAGCGRKQVDIKATLVSVTPEAVTVEVTAPPGMRVGVGTTLRKGEGTEVGPGGSARVSLLRARWPAYYGSSIQVVGEGSGFGKGKFGFTSVELPVPIKSLSLIPEGPLFFAALSGVRGRATDAVELEADEPRPEVKGTGSAFFWQPKEKSFAFFFAAPSGARITVGGVGLDAAPLGLTQADIPSEELPLHVRMESIASGKPALKLPVEVKKDGKSASYTLGFVVKARRLDWLAERLDALSTGGRLAGAPVVDAVLLRRTSGQVAHLGAPGEVAQARLVAVEKGSTRTGRRCPYSSFSYQIRYEDITVHVYDAHAGGEIASKSFPSPSAECLIIASSAEKGEKTYRVKDEVVSEWLERGRTTRVWK